MFRHAKYLRVVRTRRTGLTIRRIVNLAAHYRNLLPDIYKLRYQIKYMKSLNMFCDLINMCANTNSLQGLIKLTNATSTHTYVHNTPSFH